jgi:hypothetical protein
MLMWHPESFTASSLKIETGRASSINIENLKMDLPRGQGGKKFIFDKRHRDIMSLALAL